MSLKFRFGFLIKMQLVLLICSIVTSLAMTGIALGQEQAFEKGANTQVETEPLLTDDEALKAWQVPEGFEIQLYASAPEISQPIAATFDIQGRMWLAENYTYSERPNIFQRDKSDRILVLEDSNGDGKADSVKVFWDQAKLLSSVEVGRGGVWALCAPELVFIPDVDGDAVADGPPQVILDGFEDNEVGHNMVNGLRWGPDGWLYGRHGIQATSHVGRPGTEIEKRIPLNCCIWRYHPVAQKFEVVCQGTTNSWGHDWTDDGELFFINTVIGHLWHAIPNSHFERMYGEDLTPYTFELTKQVADHVHWDASKERWQDVQDKTSPATMAAGGGHAHSGMLICQGDLWPKDFANDVLTVNYHGRRINRDHLEKSGTTFVGHHEADLMQTSDVWFRGIDLLHGPNQSMFILDWSDIGECHENDGVHRSSGRIYRLIRSPAKSSVKETNTAKNVLADDPYIQRITRQRLEELAFGASTRHLPQFENLEANLRHNFAEGETKQRLRSLWALNAMGAISKGDLLELLEVKDPTLRRWAVRLLSDGVYFTKKDGRPIVSNETVDLRINTLEKEDASRLIQLAATEQDSLVLVYLAAAMRNLTSDDRWQMARTLSENQTYANDRVFPLLVWYGLEPAVVDHADEVASWIADCKIPKLTEFVARRLAIEHTIDQTALNHLIEILPDQSKEDSHLVLAGIAEGLRGWNRLNAPAGWEKFVSASKEADVAGQQLALINEIHLAFGNGLPAEQLIAIANDNGQNLLIRGNALVSLGRSIGLQSADSNAAQASETKIAIDTLMRWLPDRFVGDSAARGIAMSGNAEAFSEMLNRYANVHSNTKPVILNLATQTALNGQRLLDAVVSGTIPKDDVTPYVLRQLQLLDDKKIETEVLQLWPERKLFAKNQLQRIAELKNQLTPDVLSRGDLENGHKLFAESCAKCHKLFGEGETVGPDLTGGQRSNLTYWLQNILAPSAEVGTGFRMSIVLLNDGRTLSGVITERNTASFKLTTQTEKILVQQSEVDQIRESEMSLMPDGLLDSLNADQRRDLVVYLMSNGK